MRPVRHVASAALFLGAVLLCARPGAAQTLGGAPIGPRSDTLGGGQLVVAVNGATSPAGGSSAPVLGGDISVASLYAACERGFSTDATAPTAGGTLTVNSVAHHGYDYAVIDGNTTIAAAWASATYFTSTADSRSAILVINGDLTVNSGEVFTPPSRKLFWLLCVSGDLVVNGEISMTARGANHSATGSDLAVNGPLRIYTGDLTVGAGVLTNAEIPAAGGAGAASVGGNAIGTAGTAGTGGGTGGGGSGASSGLAGRTGSGATGTLYAGGPGGAANFCSAPPASSIDGVTRGGAGGVAVNCVLSGDRAASGGAGTPGGAGASFGAGVGSPGGTGTAGALVAVSVGAASGSGSLTANGSAGGAADGNGAVSGAGGGGGHVSFIVGSGTIAAAANGGAGGAATGAGTTREGGPGGIGTARIGVIP